MAARDEAAAERLTRRALLAGEDLQPTGLAKIGGEVGEAGEEPIDLVVVDGDQGWRAAGGRTELDHADPRRATEKGARRRRVDEELELVIAVARAELVVEDGRAARV